MWLFEGARYLELSGPEVAAREGDGANADRGDVPKHDVIARLDRATQYCRAIVCAGVINQRSGILGPPHPRGMTAEYGAKATNQVSYRQ